ncbi:hypothetical protein [Pseudomonas aeruginosa]
MHALNIHDRSVSRIFLVDDNPSIRESYDDAIYDLGVKTEEVKSVSNIIDLFNNVGTSDGFICDFHLTTSKYSTVNGDVIVSGLYQRGVPAVLCSRDAETAHSVRRFRHAIPRILTARDLNADSVVEAFSECIKEFAGNYSKDRRPWDTLVRFEELTQYEGDIARALITVPGWDPQQTLEIEIARPDMDFYDELISALSNKDPYRCRAKVNLDAKDLGDLYVKEWVRA